VSVPIVRCQHQQQRNSPSNITQTLPLAIVIHEPIWSEPANAPFTCGVRASAGATRRRNEAPGRLRQLVSALLDDKLVVFASFMRPPERSFANSTIAVLSPFFTASLCITPSTSGHGDAHRCRPRRVGSFVTTSRDSDWPGSPFKSAVRLGFVLFLRCNDGGWGARLRGWFVLALGRTC
jgi:hypothetical protein